MMVTTHTQVSTAVPRPAVPGTVLLVSANAVLRAHLAESLRGMRWTVQEAESGAEAWMCQEERSCGAVLLDDWLPDLSAREFAQQFLQCFPAVDMLSMQGGPLAGAVRSARRNELLLALRNAEEVCDPLPQPGRQAMEGSSSRRFQEGEAATGAKSVGAAPSYALPEMVGASAAMCELARLVRLVAPHPASVLIEGETGTGKELVAQAVHRLSTRAAKPFVTLNCAAIPEQLLEAELFGHTRGAFTGAVTSRTGRIEAAHGGTLFLDEIGEMPLALQAKMLRFLECGEIQRIGENETLRVDVRIVAATHQPLEQNAEEGRFRLDLFHRLAVFPVYVPALRDRFEDLPMLVTMMLERLGQTMPKRSIRAEAMEKLEAYAWPGNVRELLHVLQRAAILSSEGETIEPEHILLRTGRRRPGA